MQNCILTPASFLFLDEEAAVIIGIDDVEAVVIAEVVVCKQYLRSNIEMFLSYEN